jgi:hypothetical protein
MKIYLVHESEDGEVIGVFEDMNKLIAAQLKNHKPEWRNIRVKCWDTELQYERIIGYIKK